MNSYTKNLKVLCQLPSGNFVYTYTCSKRVGDALFKIPWFLNTSVSFQFETVGGYFMYKLIGKPVDVVKAVNIAHAEASKVAS